MSSPEPPLWRPLMKLGTRSPLFRAQDQELNATKLGFHLGNIYNYIYIYIFNYLYNIYYKYYIYLCIYVYIFFDITEMVNVGGKPICKPQNQPARMGSMTESPGMGGITRPRPTDDCWGCDERPTNQP